MSMTAKQTKKLKTYLSLAEPRVGPMPLASLPSIRELLLCGPEDILDLARRLGAPAEQDYALIPGTEEHPRVLLVAHVDTVRHPLLHPEQLKHERGVIWTADDHPLGADDRAGVWACLQARHWLISNGHPAPPVLLTDGEECGGIGVGAVVQNDALAHLADSLHLIVEPDRAGADEFVTYSGQLPLEIIEYCGSWGYHEGVGSYSDIADLITAYRVPAINLSVGYYEQHTGNEYLVTDHMERCARILAQMCIDPPETKLEQERSRHDRYDAWGYGDDWMEAGASGGWMPRSARWGLLEEIDSAVDEGFGERGTLCGECGASWVSCACGHVAATLTARLSPEALDLLLMDGGEYGYLYADDELYATLFEAVEDEGGDENTEPTP